MAAWEPSPMAEYRKPIQRASLLSAFLCVPGVSVRLNPTGVQWRRGADTRFRGRGPTAALLGWLMLTRQADPRRMQYAGRTSSLPGRPTANRVPITASSTRSRSCTSPMGAWSWAAPMVPPTNNPPAASALTNSWMSKPEVTNAQYALTSRNNYTPPANPVLFQLSPLRRLPGGPHHLGSGRRLCAVARYALPSEARSGSMRHAAPRA